MNQILRGASRRLGESALLALMLALSAAAQAAPVTFIIEYDGSSFGNSAVGSGTITFDDSVLSFDSAASFGNVSAATLGILDFSITISGASVGNGTFGLADFAADPDGWVWETAGALDLTQDLVGQDGFIDFNWCAASFACGNPNAPGGINFFTIATAGETEQQLILTSMRVVPIPAAVWLFASGLGVMGWLSRRSG